MDIILYNIIAGFIALILGYFFGSIPVGIIIGKVFFHRDPRLEGSKNSGGTNVGRLFGKKIGLLCIILDMIKTVIPLIIVWTIIKFSSLNQTLIDNFGSGFWNNGVLYIYLAPLGAMVGHCYPVFAKFNGGKAVATVGGFVLATSWLISIVGLLVFFIVLKLKKYVSLGSMVAALSAVVVAWVFVIIKYCGPVSLANFGMYGWGDYVIAGFEYAGVVTFGAALLIFRHRTNIKRLVHGEESKIKWMN